MVVCRYGIGETIITFAKTQSENFAKKLVKVAEQHQIAMVIGLPRYENNKLYNSAVFIKPNGEIISQVPYHKQYLYGDYEKSMFVNGVTPPPKIEYGLKFGLLICFDVEIPENVRKLAQQGLEYQIGSYRITKMRW